MSDFKHTDTDGDRLTLDTYADTCVFLAQQRRNGTAVLVELTRDAARDLAAKLTEWAGPAPLESTSLVDQSGRLWAEVSDGTFVVVNDYGTGWVPCTPAGGRTLDDVAHRFGIDDGSPDYVALAAEFKPGDLAIVGDNPGTGAEPGNGYVAPEYAGAAVTVVTVYGELVTVRNHSHHCAQDVHVAHLTKAKAVPA